MHPSTRRSLGWRDEPSDVRSERALVLVPGLGTTTAIFDGLVEALAQRDPASSVVRADLPGHGLGPRTSVVDIEAIGAEVAEVVEHLDASRVVVAGLSMGGAIALEAARAAPTALAGFAMMNSGARFGSREGWQQIIDHAESSLRESAEEGRGEDEAIDGATYVACCRALAAYDGRRDVEELDVPALLIGTLDDDATPARELRELADRLPRATYSEIPGGGHHSVAQHPHAFARILMRLFDE